MDVQFPLFVFEKDDHSMYLVETPERVLYHLEAIDIENGEYLFWDSSGAGVCVSVTGDVLDPIRLCDPVLTLSEALGAYARTHKLQLPLEQSPLATWRSLQSQLPPRKTFWTRVFGPK
jgi:hypothetical protein